MFGTNPIATQRKPSDGFLVHSIFNTIQGEGPMAGHPAVFVRLAGCNLRCYWCDTEFDDGAKKMSYGDLCDAIFQARRLSPASLVVLTGGEPMLQPIVDLTYAFRTQIETAGSVMRPVSRNTTIVCSPKTPRINEELIPQVSAWKYIIAPGEVADDDGLPCVSTQIKGENAYIYRPDKDHPAPIYVQPRDDLDPVKNTINTKFAAEIAMRYGYRLSLQLHKILDLP